MKLLYIHRTRSADGQSVHISALIDALRIRGHDVSTVGPGGANAPTKLSAARGVRLKRFTPKALYEIAEYGYSFPSYWRLQKAAKKFTPDILYERYNLFHYAGVWLKRKSNLPLLLEVNAPLAEERAQYGGLFFKERAKRAEADIWNAADRVLAVSDAMAERIQAAGVAREKISVVRNGAATAFPAACDGASVRNRYGLNNKIVLGFVGFAREWNGLERVIDFLTRLNRDDVHFMLVGDGPVRPALEAAAAQKGVADNLTITGVIQRDATPDFLAAFDIALLPASTPYASPLKLFEYMAAGKAIAAPNSNNIAEILKDQRDALLFNDAANGFDRIITTLIENPDLRARLGAAARQSLQKRNLTWAGAAERVETIAEEILMRNGEARR